MESDTNVGLGMVPHKKACRCLECESERHEAEIKDLKSKLESVTAGFAIEHEKFLRANERATAAESRLEGAVLEINHRGDELSELRAELASASSRLDSLQAKLDAVMLEYCPDEMTPEQIEQWERHQRPAGQLLRLESSAAEPVASPASVVEKP